MKRIYNNWLTRLLFFVGGIFSLRLIATALHMTTLEKLYKPRDFRKTSHIDLGPDVIETLPRYCQTIFGRKMDPINLFFIATEAGLRRSFEKAGWSGAHASSPVTVGLGLASSIFNRTYQKGPFMPLFISVGMQDLAFQKVLHKGYGQRHHVRIWRTRHHLPNGNRLWVAAATYEKSFKFTKRPPFLYHHMEPNLDFERDYIASELVKQGHLAAGEFDFHDPIKRAHPRRNPNGDPYYTNGKSVAIEIV